jgi:hypothetical protein
LQVADQAVLTDVWVAVHRNVLSNRYLLSFCFTGSSPRVVQAESVGVGARAPLSSERKGSALLGVTTESRLLIRVQVLYALRPLL